MHLVHWFEIPVNNLERARDFYESVFLVQLTPIRITKRPLLVFPSRNGEPGAIGALIADSDDAPSHDGSTVYFSVDDIEDALSRVEAAGGERLIEKTSIGVYGSIAHFEDTEGNKVALLSVE